MNRLIPGGRAPGVGLLLCGLAACLGAGCASSGRQTRLNWSEPNPARPLPERVVVVPAQPAPESRYRPEAAPAETAPPPAAPRPSGTAAAPPPPPQPHPASEAARALSLPSAIVDDRHRPESAPADREHFRVIPESRAQVYYTVRKGDTLMSIARDHYGDDSAWQRIFQANRDILPSAGQLQPGMTLKMP